MHRATPTRVVVVGTSCVGKSTFAKRLSAAWDIPRIELDFLFWSQDRRPKPKTDFVDLIAQATVASSWIVDGNYGSVRESVWSRATHVIWLNYSLPLNLWRGFKRTLVRCITREELWHCNRESFKRSFMSKESILVWIFTTHARRQREFIALRTSPEFSNLSWLEFRRPSEAESWLRSVENAA